MLLLRYDQKRVSRSIDSEKTASLLHLCFFLSFAFLQFSSPIRLLFFTLLLLISITLSQVPSVKEKKKTPQAVNSHIAFQNTELSFLRLFLVSFFFFLSFFSFYPPQCSVTLITVFRQSAVVETVLFVPRNRWTEPLDERSQKVHFSCCTAFFLTFFTFDARVD